MTSADKPGDLTVGLIQVEAASDKVDKNLSVYQRLIDRLQQSVDLLVLPETFATGFTADPASFTDTWSQVCVDWMMQMAARHGCHVAGSLAMQRESDHCNRLIVVNASGIVASYDKFHLYTPSGEHHRYAAGEERVVFNLSGWRILPRICYDLRFPVTSFNAGDYDLMLIVANWPTPRHQAWETLLPARAIENQAYVVAVNRLGQDAGGWQYRGGSAVIDYMGKYCIEPQYGRGIFVTRLSHQPMMTFRQSYPFLGDA